VSDQRRVDEVDEIRLALPAVASYARVARLALSGVASRFGWSYDDLVDLRIVIGEAFAVLVTPERAQLTLRFTLDERTMVLEASREPAAPDLEVTELTRQIIAAVVDQAEIDDHRARIRVVKQRGS
jgi:anti-sigma regulatory factor (Ser/Thr protein kinase)